MKRFTTFVLLSATALTATAATEQEYNFKERVKDWTFTQRSRENTWHFEAGHRLYKDVDFTFRYADLDGTVEKRYKFTSPLWNYGNFALSGRMELRTFDNKEDHWRYRFIVDYKQPITNNVEAWVKLQPRWAFKDKGVQFDARDQAGVAVKLNNVKFGPFIERTAKDDWKTKSGTVVGTNFEVRL